MRIAKMIRLYRANEGVDQKTLAAEIGIGASTLNRIEKGKSPDAAGAIKIMAWLFGEEDVAVERTTLRLNFNQGSSPKETGEPK